MPKKKPSKPTHNLKKLMPRWITPEKTNKSKRKMEIKFLREEIKTLNGYENDNPDKDRRILIRKKKKELKNLINN